MKVLIFFSLFFSSLALAQAVEYPFIIDERTGEIIANPKFQTKPQQEESVQIPEPLPPQSQQQPRFEPQQPQPEIDTNSETVKPKNIILDPVADKNRPLREGVSVYLEYSPLLLSQREGGREVYVAEGQLFSSLKNARKNTTYGNLFCRVFHGEHVQIEPIALYDIYSNDRSIVLVNGTNTVIQCDRTTKPKKIVITEVEQAFGDLFYFRSENL